MAIIHLDLPAPIADDVEQLLNALCDEMNAGAVKGDDARRREWQRATGIYLATRKVPDGYVLHKRGKTEWLEPLSMYPSANVVTKRGLFSALIKLGLTHSHDEIRTEMIATNIKKGRPTRR